MFFSSGIVTAILAMIYFYSKPIDPSNDNYELQVKYASLVQKLLLLTPFLIKIGLNIVVVQLALKLMNEAFMSRMVKKYDGLKDIHGDNKVNGKLVGTKILAIIIVGILAFMAPAVDIKYTMDNPNYQHYNPEFSNEFKDYMMGIYGPLFTQTQAIYHDLAATITNIIG